MFRTNFFQLLRLCLIAGLVDIGGVVVDVVHDAYSADDFNYAQNAEQDGEDFSDCQALPPAAAYYEQRQS